MSSIYKQEFLYHYRNQPNNRKLKRHSHSAKFSNISCGDEVEVQVLVENEKGVVKDLGYGSTGCAISTGSMSILSEYVIGKKLKEVKKMTPEEYLKVLQLDLTPSREKCALVGYMALMKALDEKR